jgi:hypothetical protein
MGRVLCALCFVLCALCLVPCAGSGVRGAGSLSGLRSPLGEGGCVVAAAPPSGADAPSLVLGLRLRRSPWFARRSLEAKEDGGFSGRLPTANGQVPTGLGGTEGLTP